MDSLTMRPPKTLRYRGQLYVLAATSVSQADSDYYHDGKFHGNWSDRDEHLKGDVETLRSLGVRVKLSHSPYMGHHILMIHQDDFSKALKVMKDYSMDFRKEFREFFQKLKARYQLK